MDILFHIIGWILHALFEPSQANKAPSTSAAPARPGRGTVQRPVMARTQSRPMAPLTPSVIQSPENDGERLRSVITLLAIVLLVVMAAAWILFMQGWL